MGLSQSEIRRRDEELCGQLLSAAQSSDLIPDIGIDHSLMKFSGLNSTAELENSIIQDLTGRIPDQVTSLGSALAAFNSVPHAVGLGAVALAIALELIIRFAQSESVKKESTLYMMHRVFAEEKASGVRDSMDEYLKRLRMHLHDPTRALAETERLEPQLSEQLTRLKNSMLHDDQMSSRSLKHWVNGAAFHLQMLIHEERLKMQINPKRKVHLISINSVLDTYQTDLDDLLKKYKIYKQSTISFERSSMSGIMFDNFLSVKDTEFKRQSLRVLRGHRHTDEGRYVDYMFDKWSELKELKLYFSDLKENVNDLVNQNNTFILSKVFSVPDN